MTRACADGRMPGISVTGYSSRRAQLLWRVFCQINCVDRPDNAGWNGQVIVAGARAQSRRLLEALVRLRSADTRLSCPSCSKLFEPPTCSHRRRRRRLGASPLLRASKANVHYSLENWTLLKGFSFVTDFLALKSTHALSLSGSFHSFCYDVVIAVNNA
uniref:Uncharacterized protein n=1 Tax=Ascaris lumbricoides TaxID=6252 RepID=A0A9J2P340_ASCLU